MTTKPSRVTSSVYACSTSPVRISTRRSPGPSRYDWSTGPARFASNCDALRCENRSMPNTFNPLSRWIESVRRYRYCSYGVIRRPSRPRASVGMRLSRVESNGVTSESPRSRRVRFVSPGKSKSLESAIPNSRSAWNTSEPGVIALPPSPAAPAAAPAPVVPPVVPAPEPAPVASGEAPNAPRPSPCRYESRRLSG